MRKAGIFVVLIAFSIGGCSRAVEPIPDNEMMLEEVMPNTIDLATPRNDASECTSPSSVADVTSIIAKSVAARGDSDPSFRGLANYMRDLNDRPEFYNKAYIQSRISLRNITLEAPIANAIVKCGATVLVSYGDMGSFFSEQPRIVFSVQQTVDGSKPLVSVEDTDRLRTVAFEWAHEESVADADREKQAADDAIYTMIINRKLVPGAVELDDENQARLLSVENGSTIIAVSGDGGVNGSDFRGLLIHGCKSASDFHWAKFSGGGAEWATGAAANTAAADYVDSAVLPVIYQRFCAAKADKG